MKNIIFVFILVVIVASVPVCHMEDYGFIPLWGDTFSL